MVYNSYLKVMAKDGGAGMDKQRIEMFNEDLSGNLYKIRNRMTSGSYFPPPVRTVFIPKKQGGVISPLLANIYLHHAFDKWMDECNLHNPFERYADDIVIHCHSKEEAEQLLAKLANRLQQFELALHSEKTKIVYCKNYKRPETHEHESFTFLSYSFQPRSKRNNFGGINKTYIVFAAAISSTAKTGIREVIRSILKPRWS